MKLTDFKTPKTRRAFVEKELKINLKNIKSYVKPESDAVHCENQIGYTNLPLGVAGPLKILGTGETTLHYIPLATTEGALIASVHRGCKVINLSGGVNVYVEKKGTTRSPVFFTGSTKKSNILIEWVNKNKKQIESVIKTTSGHISLLDIEAKLSLSYVFFRFIFNTQDAMGMNMATIATQKAAEYITAKTGAACISIAGNLDSDKKPAWIHAIKGRGFSVQADVIISKKTVQDVLKTTPESLFQVWLSKCMIGSAIAGSIGFNAHFANIAAAFFAATGQDLAHVVEASIGMTIMNITESGDLYVGVMIPALMLGVVGGGTKLEIKKEAIALTGTKKSADLAIICGGAVLAGELSLLASLAQGTLAKAHKTLGR